MQIRDAIPSKLRALLEQDFDGPWYSLGEHDVAPFARKAGRGVNFIPWYEADHPRSDHGENRSWLVLGYSLAEGSPQCMIRPGSSVQPGARPIVVGSHRGRHDQWEQQTCRFVKQERYRLVPGTLVSYPVSLLKNVAFECREPEYKDISARLRDWLTQRTRRQSAGRREAGGEPQAPDFDLAGDATQERRYLAVPQVGEQFEVEVTDVTSYGALVVEPLTRCKGLVHVSQLSRESPPGGLREQLPVGSWIRVKVLATDEGCERIRFGLVDPLGLSQPSSGEPHEPAS
jgi:hypothetical protein